MIAKILNIVFFVLIFANSSLANTDTLKPFFDKSDIEIREFDYNKLAKYKSNKEFDYYRNYQTPETIWDYINYWFQRFINFIFGDGNPIGIVIKYALIIGLIFIVILFLTKSKFRLLFYKNKAVKDDILISELNENIHKINISDLINNAKSNKNWRFATRYYYLKLLKSLSDRNLIVWEINKTNNDYLNELRKNTLFEEFKELSNIYSYVWYGNFVIDEASFIEISVKFDTLLQEINHENNRGNE